MIACLNADGRPVCRAHEGPWADERPDPMGVIVDIDPTNPNRCVCPECAVAGFAQKRPPDLAFLGSRPNLWAPDRRAQLGWVRVDEEA